MAELRKPTVAAGRPLDGREARCADVALPRESDAAATPDSQTARYRTAARRCDQLTPAQGVEEAQTIALEPLASSVAETGDNRDARTGDWVVDPTARLIPLSVQTAPRSPWFRIVLLLLMMGVLTQDRGLYTGEATGNGGRHDGAAAVDQYPEARTALGRTPGRTSSRSSRRRRAPSCSWTVSVTVSRPAQLVLTAGIHEVTLVSPIGTVRRKVRVIPGHPTLFSEADLQRFAGHLVPQPRSRCGFGGSAVGGHELVLPPGSYQLELLNPDDGTHTMHTVEILPGQVTTFDAGAPRGN